jgi:hypothetical protein
VKRLEAKYGQQSSRNNQPQDNRDQEPLDDSLLFSKT